MAATIKNKVLAKLGQNNETYLDDINALKDLWSDTIWQTLTINMPSRLMLSVMNPSVDPANLDYNDEALGDGIFMEDRHPLMVVRTAANHTMDGNSISIENYIRKSANRTSLEKSYQALDNQSIYYATNTSPVYWIEKKTVDSVSAPRLYTAPSTTGYTAPGTGITTMPNTKSALEVYYIDRFYYRNVNPIGGDQEDNVLLDGHTTIALKYTEEGVGTADHTIVFNEVLPQDGENLVVTKLALAVVNQKLANAAIQDEDSEIVGLLQNQMKVLSEEVELEVKRLEELWSD